ncbi:FAD:protein FMN transferase [Halopseudomonas pelagia]|uniref:FAD:protein FMN transferase n=1 Tax=Halopseudomonas pelagia TaxID=553151 RepID=UPI00278BBF9D|nr:FAD:protein FMN transferase [Halopseudomonas pelagia]
MGSTYSIKWVNAEGVPDTATLHGEIEALLSDFDAEVSTWRDDSDLARFNAMPADSCAEVPTSLLELVGLGHILAEDSGGDFDLTVGPLLRIWGFHGGNGSQVVPDPEELQAALEQVGQRHLQVNGTQLCKSANVQVDVSAIAAGYAVDKVVDHLLSRGINSYMVEITGELKAAGVKPDNTPWKIAIEEPRDDQRMAHLIVALDGQAVSTSGDYRNYFEYEGKRYSHTFDPSSGRPVMHELAAVTVLHNSAATADGLSTVLLVKGPEKGWDYALEHEVAALFVVRDGTRFVSRATPTFTALTKSEE